MIIEKNTLGLPNKIFSSLASGVDKALSGVAGGLPSAAIGFLSGIIGGSSAGPTPISLNLKADMQLEGTGTNGGSLPSTPISFWVPGTNIASNAVGYIPLYNKSLGVINFSGKPTIIFNVERDEWYEPDGQETEPTILITKFSVNFPASIDYSSYLIINPEVKKTAKVTIEKQDLVQIEAIIYENGGKKMYSITENPESDFLYWGGNYSVDSPTERNVKYGDRFTISIKPFDGSPSSTIIKTLLLQDEWNWIN